MKVEIRLSLQLSKNWLKKWKAENVGSLVRRKVIGKQLFIRNPLRISKVGAIGGFMVLSGRLLNDFQGPCLFVSGVIDSPSGAFLPKQRTLQRWCQGITNGREVVDDWRICDIRVKTYIMEEIKKIRCWLGKRGFLWFPSFFLTQSEGSFTWQVCIFGQTSRGWKLSERKSTDHTKKVRDPRVQVRHHYGCSNAQGDLSMAKVYYSRYGDLAEQSKARTGLEKQQGTIKRELGRNLRNYTKIPDLTLSKTESIEYR